jgi:hypothetical protein
VSIQTLSALENAIEPYRQAGYVISIQTESAITLRAPARKFSWTLFVISLVLLWPVAVIYLIRFNQQKDRSVCVRITSQSQIETSGFTLDMLEKEQQRRSFVALFLIISGVIVGLLFLIYVGFIKK